MATLSRLLPVQLPFPAADLQRHRLGHDLLGRCDPGVGGQHGSPFLRRQSEWHRVSEQRGDCARADRNTSRSGNADSVSSFEFDFRRAGCLAAGPFVCTASSNPPHSERRNFTSENDEVHFRERGTSAKIGERSGIVVASGIGYRGASWTLGSQGRTIVKGLRTDKGFTLIELLIVVTIIGVVAATAVPGLLRARITANETSAIGTLRALSAAETSYSLTCGAGAYAVLFTTLAVGPGLSTEGYISPDLAGGGQQERLQLPPRPRRLAPPRPPDCNGIVTNSATTRALFPWPLARLGRAGLRPARAVPFGRIFLGLRQRSRSWSVPASRQSNRWVCVSASDPQARQT